MAALETGRVVQLEQLAVHRLGDFRPAVASGRGEEARGTVEDLPAIRRPVIHALRPGDELGLGLEVAIGRERHPVTAEGDGLDGGWHWGGSFADPAGNIGSWCPHP